MTKVDYKATVIAVRNLREFICKLDIWDDDLQDERRKVLDDTRPILRMLEINAC